MYGERPAFPQDIPPLGVALISSNITAIAAELIAETVGYEDFIAMRRRNNHTKLPVAMDYDEWQDKLRRIGYLHAAREIREADAYISEMVSGRPFDCFLNHSKDLFCQLLATHPLCHKFYYIEEGITSHVGGRFAATRVSRQIQPFVWGLRSRIFYQNRLNIFCPHFDIERKNYGGVYAISPHAFPDFPNRFQLPFGASPFNQEVPTDVVLFLDSQYISRSVEAEYRTGMMDCLRSLLKNPQSVGIKFHPREQNAARKQRFIDAVRSLDQVTGIIELPSEFVGERMSMERPVTVVVGMTALAIYLGERGFPTYYFAHRVKELDVVEQNLPPNFYQVCMKG